MFTHGGPLCILTILELLYGHIKAAAPATAAPTTGDVQTRGDTAIKAAFTALTAIAHPLEPSKQTRQSISSL